VTATASRPAALLALVLALGVAGCGVGDAAPTAATSSPPTASTSAVGEVDTALDPDGFLDELQSVMEDTGTGRFSTDGFAMTADGVFDLGRGAVRATATIEGTDLDLVVVDGTAYVLDDESDLWDELPEGAVDAGGFTPEGTFADWRASATSVAPVGEEAIDGRTYTRYELTLDTAAFFADKGQSPPEGAPETFAYDVWVDDARLLRRVAFEIDGQRQVVDYTDWGDAVEIDAPPANRIRG
jgi:hypothetical protein